MKIRLLDLLVILSLITSCQKPVPRHPNLTMIEDKNGGTIKKYDFVSITFTEKTEDGKNLRSSGEYDDRAQLLFLQPPVFKGDFASMISFLSKGDSAQFKISIDSLKRKMGRKFPPYVKGHYIIYNIRVNDVVTRGSKSDREYDAAIEDYKLKAFYLERDREQDKINAYIVKHKLALQKAPLGFMYKIIQQGSGEKAGIGDSVVANYTGESLTGKVFETTMDSVAKQQDFYKQAQIYRPYGERLISEDPKFAFTEALKMFPKNSKVMLLIPSRLSYGGEYHGPLPPYTPVVCHLEIVDVIKTR